MPASPLPPNVLDALRRGNTVDAIKHLRASTGLGLKEAKDVIDGHVRGNPVPVVAAAPAGSPGEIPTSGNVVWFFLAVTVAALIGFLFPRSPG